MILIPFTVPEGSDTSATIDFSDYLNPIDSSWSSRMSIVRLVCPSDVSGATSVTLEFANEDGATFAPEVDLEGTVVSSIAVADDYRVRLNPSDWCWLGGKVRLVVDDADYEAPEGGLTFYIGVRRV